MPTAGPCPTPNTKCRALPGPRPTPGTPEARHRDLCDRRCQRTVPQTQKQTQTNPPAHCPRRRRRRRRTRQQTARNCTVPHPPFPSTRAHSLLVSRSAKSGLSMSICSSSTLLLIRSQPLPSAASSAPMLPVPLCPCPPPSAATSAPACTGAPTSSLSLPCHSTVPYKPRVPRDNNIPSALSFI